MPLTFEQSKDEIAQLVRHFTINRDAYHAPAYKEAHARQEFIDAFFSALGWDVHNTQRLAPDYREVVIEDSVDIEGQKKAPDYVFRIGRERKFFAEAKKPGIDLKQDAAPAYQLRRYAWTAKLPLSLLMDFEELAAYDCRRRPSATDKPSVGRVNYFNCAEYADRWRELWDVFSREAVWGGSFDQYAQTSKGKRGTSEVDTEFLKEIEGWREALARNMALRNPRLSIDELNDAVQRTIDRIIFLRMTEDRGIEDYGRLLRLAEGENIYPGLVTLFRHADAKYNSGLFDFSRAGDRLTPGLSVDDKTLKPILADMYFPQSPYEFSVLPVEILGNVYEQFLGKVIRLTPAHQAKVEEKPEVKKAGGVYYTPAYIVNYIVQNTVGKLVEGKSPLQLRGFRVVDPACGSGSFLLGAYQYLLDYYQAWYAANSPEKYPKAVWQAGEAWRLTAAEKKRILTEHIFGADIDRQAVEVTKLSLLLAVLESETGDGESKQLALMPEQTKERVLPNLDRNIKCGNSLIGPDYFAGQLPPDEAELRRVNPFDWQREFPEAMQAGGFDCVIGNPPYVLLQTLEQPSVFDYLARSYVSATYKIDTYQVFIEKGISLTKLNGRFGYITPNTFLKNKFAVELRNFILAQANVELLKVFFYDVFQGASVDTSIVILSRTQKPDFGHTVNIVRSYSPSQSTDAIQQLQQVWLGHPERFFVLPGTAGSDELATKISLGSIPLGEFATAYFGIQTFDRSEYVRATRQSKHFKPVIDGGNISRYFLSESTEFVDFQPNAIKSGGKQAVYEQTRIGVRQIGDVPIPTILPAGIYTLNTIYNIYFTKPTQYEITFILGLIASKAVAWYWRQNFYDQKRTFPKIKKEALLSIPVPRLTSPIGNARHDQIVASVKTLLDLHQRMAAAEDAGERERLQRLIDSTDQQIDALVYELYGLTAEEIAIVEGAKART
jgi:TaqI-like C-terminal specificity domain/Eco57I restriction-modification methylase/N-6 DNA Methylase